MFYKMGFDMEKIDEAIKEGINTIYAEKTNMDEIEYDSIKKGFFDNIILAPGLIKNWPNVEFYYSSLVSDLESEYLLNIKRWPIIHKKVMEEFNKKKVGGIKFYPIRLIDVVTQKVNNNYFLMYVENFIDAFDMEKSKYKYNEKYNFYTFIPKETYLNKSECNKYDIFRCAQSVASIYVSERIKKIVEENNWVGFAFYEQQ